MDGRPFRIATAGLGAALLASIVAGVSHFRIESRLIARADRIPAAKVETPVIAVPADLLQAAKSRTAPDREDTSTASPTPTAERRTSRPPTNVVSNVRRKKEFVELPPPPEFRDDPEPATQLVTAPLPVRNFEPATDPRLLAEITSLRRELEQLTRQQRLEHEIERDRHDRQLSALSTEHKLADLKATLEELKSAQLDRRIAMLQTETPTPVFERPAPEPEPQLEPEAKTEPPTATTVEPVPPVSQPVEVLESPAPDHFDFHFDGANLHAALAQIGQRGGMNLVVSSDIAGEVTASWNNVTPREALEALRLAHNLTIEPQGQFLLVSTAKTARGRTETSKNTLVQMFRPLYISARDLKPLIEPLLTPDIGRISVTLQQSTDDSQRVGGGDSLAQPDALIIVDYPEVVEVVERTIAEIDVPAPHVELEATILDVQLSGRVKNGVSSLIASGEFSNRPGFASLDAPQQMPCDSCCQTSDMSCAEVVDRLKLWTDVKVVSSARLLVLNKQPAELNVGSESICFLPSGHVMPTAAVDAGMRLSVRPFVSADHLVRLQVSPESVTSRAQPMNTRRETVASVATNVAVPNGGSLVIAGLNVDQSVAPSAIFQGLGRLKKKHKDEADRAIRREIVIMVTPRVVQGCGSAQ